MKRIEALSPIMVCCLQHCVAAFHFDAVNRLFTVQGIITTTEGFLLVLRAG